MKTLTISQDNFKQGLQLLEDDSRAGFGSARSMLNCQITDRGGIAPRPGTVLLGDYNSNGNPIRGLFNFRKSKGDPEILTKFYDDEFEFYHPTLQTWSRVKNGFTANQEFGYLYTLVNTDNDDFMYFCNRYEEYQRWQGSYATITSALAGAETSIPVDSVLQTPIYLTVTATGSSATTLDVASAVWANDMWKNFYIYIPSTGKVRLITANTGTQITFSTLGSDPGSVAFQIRQLKFPLTGTVIYNGTTIAYTTIDIATALPVASAHACPINTAVTLVPTIYIAAPRGNRMEILRGRPYVGRVRMAISRDAAGNTQASAQAGSVFVAKLLDPTTFTFSASRVAGEGDIANIAYGGGDIVDVKAFEDQVAIYKKDYIELLKYTEDENDVALRTPLKPGVGSIARVIKGSDDHYFMTPDKRYTSLGRVRTKDLTPQTENLGYRIKRLLDTYDHTDFNGIEFNNRLLSCHRTDSNNTSNDVTLVFNKQTKSFEGVWTIPANNYEIFNNELVYGESNGSNTWKMFQTRKADIRGDSILPYSTEWQSNFFNVLPIKSNIQAVNSIAIEGYISTNSTFTFKLYKNFETESSLSFNFSGTEDSLLQGTDLEAIFMGGEPLGLQPIGSIDAPDSDGRRRFSFMVYFPYIYGQYFSTKFSSSGVDQDWEIIRTSLGLKENISTKTDNIKSIT